MSQPRSRNYLKQVQDTFQIKAVPFNVRVTRYLESLRLFRIGMAIRVRLCRRLLSSPWTAADGSFVYQKDGAGKEVGFDGHNGQFHALYEEQYRHGYETETSVLLMRLAQGKRVFYDVGSNWGYFSLLLAASPDYSGPIYAFEPNPRPFADLERSIRQAGVSDRVTPINCGLGREAGELHLDELDQFLTGSTKLSAKGAGKKVAVQTLDSLTLPPPDILKIDAEGMEVDIFAGGEKMLTTRRPFVVFESFLNFEDPAQTLEPLRALSRLGYRLFNPALLFKSGGNYVLASYADSVATLLPLDSNPSTGLVEITEKNRFIMRHQLNVFACHESRLHELPPDEFEHIQ